MAESQSLRLLFELGAAQARLMDWLAAQLAKRGHAGVTPSALGFLGQLDCGPNHAAAVARRLGVSRQMVAKTVAEMAAKGWLELVPDPVLRNRKVIEFTIQGERLMADSRAILAQLDDILRTRLGADWAAGLRADLDRLMKLL
ncbi:MAG: winged helix DNA-binding protein [Sphingomonadales bacterium]